MTTLDDFHKRLDRAPRDWQTRLVLADWLDEYGGTEEDRLRARGYRALAEARVSPYLQKKETATGWPTWRYLNYNAREAYRIQKKRIPARERSAVIPLALIGPMPHGPFAQGEGYGSLSRRELEDKWAFRIGTYLTQQETKK